MSGFISGVAVDLPDYRILNCQSTPPYILEGVNEPII